MASFVRGSSFCAVGVGVGLMLAGCGSLAEKPVDEITYHATYPTFTSEKELAASASHIIQGTVISATSQWFDASGEPSDSSDPEANPQLGIDSEDDAEPLLYTFYEVEIGAVGQGDVKEGQQIVLRQLGGETNESRASLEGAGQLRAGGEYVLYIVAWPDGSATLVNATQSAYERVSGGGLVSVGDDDSLRASVEDNAKAWTN